MQTEQHYHSTLFPKITLCMNSIHSRKRLSHLNISEETIRSYYGYNIGYNITYPNITFSDTFFRDTRPDYYIFDCSYIGHSCKNTRLKNGKPDKVYWKHVLSMAGNCIEFDPNTVSHHANETEAVSSYGYHRSLSILIGYNKVCFSSISRV